MRIEVQLARGLPAFALVGQPGAATRESRERVYGALRQAGFALPTGRVTVNLAPAEEPKQGSAFDLPLALGLLEASGQLRVRRGRDWWLLGELGLDGRLLPVRGALPLGLAARAAGAAGVVLPAGNAAEAAHLADVECRLHEDLRSVIRWVEGGPAGKRAAPAVPARRRDRDETLLLPGGAALRRALCAAAAGRHGLLLLGAPGNGKTTLARALVRLLPPLSRDEFREVQALRSAAGLPLSAERRPPLRAPHHSLSASGLLGRAAGGGLPGELSLAHRGLLFLDELPEFRRDVLEALRGPLESGRYTLRRAHAALDWPARFQLVAAMNPCPCGLSLRGPEHCRCTPQQRRRYRGRLSGALLDRIELILEVPDWRPGEVDRPLAAGDLRGLRARVLRARRRLERGGVAPPPKTERRWLDARLAESGASLRRRGGLGRLARSLAALDGRSAVERGDLLEAMELGLRWRLVFGELSPRGG